MPVTYVIAEDAEVVLLTLRGEVGPGERVSVIQSIVSDATFRPGMDVVEDHRDLATDDDVAAVRGFVSALERHGDAFRGTRWAIIESTPSGYGMANLTSALADETTVEMRAFRDMGEARLWLHAKQHTGGQGIK